MVARRHIRLKILKPVAGENVGAKPTCVSFLGRVFRVATYPPACLHVTQRLGATCYTLASTPPPSNPKSYSRKREDNHHRGGQSVREKISK